MGCNVGGANAPLDDIEDLDEVGRPDARLECRTAAGELGPASDPAARSPRATHSLPAGGSELIGAALANNSFVRPLSMKADPGMFATLPSSSSWRRRSTLGEALNGKALGKGHHVLAVARAVGVSTRAGQGHGSHGPLGHLTHRLRTHGERSDRREAHYHEETLSEGVGRATVVIRRPTASTSAQTKRRGA